jgi:molybdate transport system regulatory protein
MTPLGACERTRHPHRRTRATDDTAGPWACVENANTLGRMTKTATAELWIKVNLPGVGQIGPGKINLLRQIRTQESISGAARAMKMSYRRAWLLVDELNKLFAKPLVATWAGGKSRGGASLTKLGEQLIENYDTVVERAMRANQTVLGEIARSVNGGADAEH